MSLYSLILKFKEEQEDQLPPLEPVDRFPLHQAAYCCQSKEIEKLLSSGLNPRECDEDGWTPLHYAICYDNKGDCVKLLLKADALSVYTLTERGRLSTLHLAITYNQRNNLIILLPYYCQYLNEMGIYCTNPLSIAITDDNVYFADILIEKGASIITAKRSRGSWLLALQKKQQTVKKVIVQFIGILKRMKFQNAPTNLKGCIPKDLTNALAKYIYETRFYDEWYKMF